MQVGPQSSCQQTDPPPLTHTHLDVCRFGFSPGGGGEEQPGNSRDPVCDDSFSRRGWKRRRHCWQIAGFPSPFLRWGLVTCGWSGNPLCSAAQRGPLVGGRWRPWRPLHNSAATKASPEGFAVEAAGLPAPRCFRPSLPLVAPNLRPGAGRWPQYFGRGRPLSFSWYQEEGELMTWKLSPGPRGLRTPEQDGS